MIFNVNFVQLHNSDYKKKNPPTAILIYLHEFVPLMLSWTWINVFNIIAHERGKKFKIYK